MVDLLVEVTLNLAKVVKHARKGISVVTKVSLNGTLVLRPKTPTKVPKACWHAANTNTRCSRNCTKHQVRCDYMDNPTASSIDEISTQGEQPNLLWTPEIERSIDIWQQQGRFPFPFPELHIYPQPHWGSYSRDDLRLLYHVSQISNDMIASKSSKLTLWIEYMPRSVIPNFA